MSTNYFVKLKHFEGPLDLLLQLIRVHELDIFDINLLVLTSQYLEHLRHIKFRDLKDAAAFIEMAAVLIEIKSKRLLPIENDGQNSGDEDAEEDPTKTLQQRLLDYDAFRQVALLLGERAQLSERRYSSSENLRLESEYEALEAPLTAEPAALLILYEQLFANISDKKPISVTAVKEQITLDEVMDKIDEIISNLEAVLFHNLYEKVQTRYELVAYLLASLQMAKDDKIKLYQREFFGPLWLYNMSMTAEDLQQFEQQPKMDDKE